MMINSATATFSNEFLRCVEYGELMKGKEYLNSGIDINTSRNVRMCLLSLKFEVHF